MAAPRIAFRALKHSSWTLSPTQTAARLSSSRAFASNSTSARFLRAGPIAGAAWMAEGRAGAGARRAFSSTPRAAGWLPAFMGGSSPPPPPAPKLEERHYDDAGPVAASPPPPSPSPPELPSLPSIDELPIPPPTPSGNFLTTANDVLISTGTLDLSSLSTSFGPHPIMRLQSVFLQLHESFPFLGYTPWYILIPIVTIFTRFLLFPFQVRSQGNAARMAIIQPRMLAGMEKVKAAKASGDVVSQQSAMVEVQTLMKDNNVNPIKGLAFPIAQGAVFMTMFFALQGLAGAEIGSMMTEGFGWVTDLTAKDPYWVLPLTSTSLTLATLEFGMDTQASQAAMAKNMKVMFRVLLVVCVPFIAAFPAVLLMYWTTNNFISLLQSQLLKQPAVRKLFGIPTIPPKPLPGHPGYVKEPGFAEAFRNVQVGVSDKFEAAAEKRAEEDRVRTLREAEEAPVVPNVYVPRAPMPKKATKVEEVIEKVTGEKVGRGKGEIIAERRTRGPAEERARQGLGSKPKRR